MVDVRRAYGSWLMRRMLWLVPSFLLSCAVGADLVSDPALQDWVRIPSLVLAVGVAILFAALSMKTLLVLREKWRGRSRRAQLLRKELHPYPGIGLAGLGVLTALLAVPSLFPKPPPVSARVVHRRPAAAVGSPISVAAAADRDDAVAAVAVPEAPVISVPEPPGVPQIVPELARLPELPFLWDEPEPFARPAVRNDGDRGGDEFVMKHRPGTDDNLFPDFARRMTPFDRAGLPSGRDDEESWIPPELQVDVTLIARSGPWRGAAMETSFDMPFGRDDSVRAGYSIAMLTDQEKLDNVQPEFGWHRATLEYVRRVAGYVRDSRFDLAFRIGLTVDHLRIQDGDVRYDLSLRYSPWVGMETAFWEHDGLGLLLQAGHSFATGLGGSSSQVTDVRMVVRIDLGERSSVELGYRVVSVRFRDDAVDRAGGYIGQMDQTFMGPIAGMVLRF